jgi:hypothetical protein
MSPEHPNRDAITDAVELLSNYLRANWSSRRALRAV